MSGARTSRLRGCAVLVLATMVVSAGLIGTDAHAAGSGRRPGTARAGGGSGHLISARTLTKAHGFGLVRATPFLPPPGYAEAKARAQGERLGRKPAATVLQVVKRHAISGKHSFLDEFQFVGNQFGDAASANWAPPDTILAAGYSAVVELTNDTMRVYSKSGSVLQTSDLTAFFGGASGQSATDGKVVFDQGAGRFYMTDLLTSSSGSQIKLAVSQSSDPTGAWCVYRFPSMTDTSGNILDQPKLGFSDDKITITDNFNGGGFGSVMDVLQKSDALGGCNSIGGTIFTTDDFNVMPVTSLSSTADQYAVFNDGVSTAQLLDITGTPATGDVTYSETDQGIGGLNVPPAANQPGSSGSIDTSDNRYQSAAYQNGQVWAVGGDTCNPGDANHACVRVNEFDATNGFAVLIDKELSGGSGNDIYMPAITLDSSGDPFFTFTLSSPTIYATMASAGVVLPFGSSFPAVFNFAGDSTYTCTFCSQPRWGDFSGAARDPSDPSTIWTAAEYGARSSIGQGSNGWSTGISASTFDTPYTISAKPVSGPSSGGTVVDVMGGGFVNGGTSVAFGGVASPSVQFVSPGEVLATTPAGAAGSVSIVPSTANGSGPDLSSGFTFYPVVTGISPNAGPSAGGNSVTISGAGFGGASTVTFGGVPASFKVVDGGHITATPPAGAPGRVDVRVTTSAQTSPLSTNDQYMYLKAPLVLRVSPSVGPTAGGNRVVITGRALGGATVVAFGGVAAPFTPNGSVQITATAPSHAVGTVQVTVTTPAGTSAVTAADRYSYGPPSITSFSPGSGVTGSTVVISGAGFVRGATVSFGSLRSPAVAVGSWRQLKAIVPNGAVPGKISVTTPAGTATSAATFTPTLSITHFSPASGPAGTVVTISGAGFNAGSVVAFHGVSASAVKHVSATELQATVPVSATSGPITVTNSAAPAGNVTSRSSFTKT